MSDLRTENVSYCKELLFVIRLQLTWQSSSRWTTFKGFVHYNGWTETAKNTGKNFEPKKYGKNSVAAKKKKNDKTHVSVECMSTLCGFSSIYHWKP